MIKHDIETMVSFSDIVLDLVNDLNNKYSGKYISPNYSTSIIKESIKYRIVNFNLSIDSPPNNPTEMQLTVRCLIVISEETNHRSGIPIDYLNFGSISDEP